MGEVDEEDETYENDGKEIELNAEEIEWFCTFIRFKYMNLLMRVKMP
jgi:hypothetical protein